MQWRQIPNLKILIFVKFIHLGHLLNGCRASIANQVQHGTDSSSEDLWTGFRDRICKPFIHERPNEMNSSWSSIFVTSIWVYVQYRCFKNNLAYVRSRLYSSWNCRIQSKLRTALPNQGDRSFGRQMWLNNPSCIFLYDNGSENSICGWIGLNTWLLSLFVQNEITTRT